MRYTQRRFTVTDYKIDLAKTVDLPVIQPSRSIGWKIRQHVCLMVNIQSPSFYRL